jgi:hypothetical protein
VRAPITVRRICVSTVTRVSSPVKLPATGEEKNQVFSQPLRGGKVEVGTPSLPADNHFRGWAPPSAIFLRLRRNFMLDDPPALPIGEHLSPPYIQTNKGGFKRFFFG